MASQEGRQARSAAGGMATSPVSFGRTGDVPRTGYGHSGAELQRMGASLPSGPQKGLCPFVGPKAVGRISSVT
jgi:hypothetical protein